MEFPKLGCLGWSVFIVFGYYTIRYWYVTIPTVIIMFVIALVYDATYGKAERQRKIDEAARAAEELSRKQDRDCVELFKKVQRKLSPVELMVREHFGYGEPEPGVLDEPEPEPEPEPEIAPAANGSNEHSEPNTEDPEQHVALADPLVPKGFSEYVGQVRAKEMLRLMIGSSEKTGSHIDHILFTGMGGTGKTALAKALAFETETHFVFRTAANLNMWKPDKGIDPLYDALAEADDIEIHGKKFGLLFIDEIHRLDAAQWERLFSVLEGGIMDLPEGAVKVEYTTIVGSTTDPHMLTAPALTRFRVVNIEPYTTDEIAQIVSNGSDKLGGGIEPEAAQLIAANGRANPRLSLNTFLRCSLDVARNDDRRVVSVADVERALGLCGVVNTLDGLARIEARLLTFLAAVLKEKKANGEKSPAVGITELAYGVGESIANVEKIIEPFLVRNGYVIRTKRGRIITDKGRIAAKQFAGV